MAPRESQLLESLPERISSVFDQAQLTVANHKKNCVSLYKLHNQASSITNPAKNGTAIKLTGERAFGDLFIDMMGRLLVVKKGPPAADRVVKFVGAYVKFMNEKVVEARMQKSSSSAANPSVDEDDEDTLASRFVSRLLTWLVQGFVAKNKVVRFRALSIVSEMISHLGEIDEETYTTLRGALIDRLNDKESIVRSHAVLALSKLVGSEDPSDLEEDDRTILDILLDVLQLDPSPDVRRSVLLSLPLTPATLAPLLTRTRDTDPLTRKLLLASVLLPKLPHPQQLTIEQREAVVRDGLGDREESVRVAAGKLVGNWMDKVALVEDEAEAEDPGWQGDDGGIMKALVRFLQLFDVLGPGEAVAVDALKSIFVTRADVLDAFIFTDDYWGSLTPESALLARVFIQHCNTSGKEAKLESASLPVVTACAFLVQETYNTLVTLIQEDEASFDKDQDEEYKDKREKEIEKDEMLLVELLRIAVTLDYSDEIGRRKAFAVIRNMLAQEHLPERLIAPCLDVLKAISPSERELIRVMVEVIIELRDGDEDEDEVLAELVDEDTTQLGDDEDTLAQARKEAAAARKDRSKMTPEQAFRADVIDMRCLTLCIGMLERVNGSFEDNSTLEGILGDLIIPAVKRKELLMREKGLVSLGLCCLIAKNMALSSFQLFLGQVQSSPDDLKIKVLQIIFDLLVMYEAEFFGRSEEIAERIITFLLHTLEAEESHPVQAVLCVGISKLLISGFVKDTRVLQSLVLIYVSPATADNLALRQCLSYFFPVFCYSSHQSQSLMQSIFIPAYDLVNNVFQDLEDDQIMTTPLQFGQLFVDWTNPQKSTDPREATRDPHVDLTIDILKALYDKERNANDEKTLCQLLGHLHPMPGIVGKSIFTFYLLISNLQEQSLLSDSSAQKLMVKFQQRFHKLFAEELNALNQEEYLSDLDILDIFQLVGLEVPDKDHITPIQVVVEEHKAKPRAKKQVDDNVSVTHETASVTSASVDEDASVRSRSVTPTPAEKKPAKATRRAPPKKKQASLPPSSPGTASGSGSDRASPTPRPETPPKNNSKKRMLTPGIAEPQASPAKKRQNRGSKIASKPVNDDPFIEVEEEEESITARPVADAPKKAKPGPKPRAARTKAKVVQDEPVDIEAESTPPAKTKPKPRPSRAAATKTKPPPPPPTSFDEEEEPEEEEDSEPETKLPAKRGASRTAAKAPAKKRGAPKVAAVGKAKAPAARTSSRRGKTVPKPQSEVSEEEDEEEGVEQSSEDLMGYSES